MRIFFGMLFFIFKLYVGIVFCSTAVLFYPLLAILSLKERTHRLAFYGFACWSWVFRIMCFYHVHRIQTSKLPSEPMIIIANHASYLDIFLFHSLLSGHPFIFLGKSEILKYPLIRTYFRSLNIPVFRDTRIKAAKSLVLAKKKIQNKWSVVIFPEGGIPDGQRPEMIPFKDGAFQLAKDQKVPILPITFVNNYRLFTDMTDFFGSCYPGVAKVIIHDVISVEDVDAMLTEELKNRCFEIVSGGLVKK